MNSHELFIKTPPLKLFIIAALPGAVSMLASALYQLIDGIFVGRILGPTPFAALNLAMPFVIINFALADLIGVGSSVPISISLGEGRDREAHNIFTCACIMIIVSGIITGTIIYAAAPSLMHLMGADGEFAAYAVMYLRVYALCSPVTTIIFAVDNYLRICGIIRGSMLLNIFMALLSAVLEFLFLFVFRWGIWAAALATCLGMAVSACVAFIPFFSGKQRLRFCVPHFNGRIIKRIFVCGCPSFLSNIAGRITSVLMNFFLVRLGGQDAVSIYGILMYADGIIQSILYGMCDSLQPSVGYNWGAREYTRVKSIEKCCFTASGIFSVIAAIVMFAFPKQTVILFMGDAEGVFLSAAVFAVKLFSITYLTRWVSFASQSFMLAIEKPMPASVISISISLVFPVIFIFTLMPLGLTGMWLNLAVSSLLSGILAVFILIKTVKNGLTH